MRSWEHALLLVAIGLSVLVCNPGANAQPKTTALVSIPKEASQEDALRELHRRTGLLVLAEVPQQEHRNPADIEDAPPRDAILAITAAYQLHALVGSRRVLFVRRFLDLKEQPDYPLEELASISDGLDRLLGPLGSGIGRYGGDAAVQTAFLKSLTPEQVAAAQRAQLPFRSLSEAQRQIWHVLNADQAYTVDRGQVRDLVDLFRSWASAQGEWDLGSSDPRDAFWLRYPDPGTRSGYQTHSIVNAGELEPNEAREVGRRRGLAAASPLGESAEDLPLPRRPVTGRLSGFQVAKADATAAEIVSRIAVANHMAIRVPEWAESRRYLVFAEGCTGDEVLQALADINGWLIRSEGKGRFSLGRPAPAPANGYLDFYGKARSLLPPVLQQMCWDEWGDTELQRAPSLAGLKRAQVSMERRRLASLRLMQDLAKVRKDNQPFPIRELDPAFERIISNMAFYISFSSIGENLSRPPRPVWAFEDQGVFRLDGELGSGNHPLLRFGVLQEVQGNTDIWDTWGWFVDTADTPHKK